MISAILNTEVLSRAHALFASARKHTVQGLSRLLPSTLQRTHLAHLVDLDLFVACANHLRGEFNAPQLQSLSMRSDAAQLSECPVPVTFLVSIFNNSPLLNEIHIRRCVNTTTIAELKPRDDHNRRALSIIEVACHNEDLVSVLNNYFNVKESSNVTIELYSIAHIQSALSQSVDLVGVQRKAASSFEIRYGNEIVLREGEHVREQFFALRISFPKRFTVMFRMGERHMKWTWKAFVDNFPCDQIRHLTTTNRTDDSSASIRVHPHDLLAALSGLRSLTISDRQHIQFLSAVPLIAPITNLTVNLPHGTNLGDLVPIWHWLRDRATSPISMTLTLSGNFNGLFIYRDYHYMEAPIIAALNMYAHVVDERTANKDARRSRVDT
ncbi:unnamed protein product [Peniophora sp. CBMAI 1063]|nr:unnamed protein product [Peniophora sp. CBMAI 1063]